MKNGRLRNSKLLSLLIISAMVSAACAPSSNNLRNMSGPLLSPEYYKQNFENYEDNDKGEFGESEANDELTEPYEAAPSKPIATGKTDTEKTSTPEAAGPATPQTPPAPVTEDRPDLPIPPPSKPSSPPATTDKQNTTTPRSSKHPRPGQHVTTRTPKDVSIDKLDCLHADKLCFPVAGKTWFHDDYGAGRSGGRKHAGNDIFAKKLTPVIAIADGVVDVVTEDGRLSGNYVGINHGNGMRSLYMHLNNDSPGTNDGEGHGIMPGIKRGVIVKKGQQIGWTGNSGNAETTQPHMHFEIRMSENPKATRLREFYPINPFKILREAELTKVILPAAYRYDQLVS